MLIEKIALDHAAQGEWRPLSARSPDEIEAAAERLGDIIRSSEYGMLEHDVRWFRTKADGASRRFELFIKERGSRIIGFVPVLMHPSQLNYALGELSLFSIPVQRSDIRITPLTLAAAAATDADLAEDFLVWLHGRLNGNEVVFLDEIRARCPLYRAIKDPGSALRRLYYVVPYGPMYQHRSIEFSGSYDDYIAGLGPKTRADLSRTRRRFIARTNGKFETRCFRKPDEVNAFITEAMRVSARTYQFKLLGAGLREREALANRYVATAKLGWFRSYILYIDGEPVAFQVGHVYNGTFHAQDIGYDPAWRKLQIGIFLHTEIISDLLARSGEVTAWDFGNTDLLHKQRLSNRSEWSGFFYLVPRGARGAAISLSMICMTLVSAGLGRLLDTLRVRQKVRHLLRLMGAAR